MQILLLKKCHLTIFIADSKTKDMKPWGISKKVKNTHAVNHCFSEAKTQDMDRYIKPRKKRNADIYIPRVGTNDIKSESKSKEIAQNIINAALKLKQEVHYFPRC